MSGISLSRTTIPQSISVTGSVTASGNLVLSGATPFIGTNTADASDNKKLSIGPGTAVGSDRGAQVTLAGNEFAVTGGQLDLLGGDVATGKVRIGSINASATLELLSAGLVRWTLLSTGILSQDVTNGALLTFNKANTTINFAGTMGDSTKEPQTVAPDDWVEVQVGGVTRYIPVYAAS